jgi:hypothetical protein
MRRAILLGVFLGGTLAFSAIPVIDVAAIARLVTQISKMEAQLQQMIQTYQRITQQYQHMVYQAKYIYNRYRYHAPSTIWRGLSGRQTYAGTRRWIDAVNSGIDTVQGWENATVATTTYPGGLASIPFTWRDRRERDLATIDLQDATAISTMDTVGRVRSAGPRTESALRDLETDTLSELADMNTEAAQLNKANAMLMIQTRAQQDLNKLLVSNNEMALLRMKLERDAAAYALAIDAVFRTDGRAAFASQHANASDEMLNYRLP